jgi:hypothetical protein
VIVPEATNALPATASSGALIVILKMSFSMVDTRPANVGVAKEASTIMVMARETATRLIDILQYGFVGEKNAQW